MTIIGNRNRFPLNIEINLDLSRIGVPSVGNHFRDHRRGIAIQVESQVVEDIQTDGHSILASGHSHPS